MYLSSLHLSCLSLCLSNGRAVHYNGSSLLQWKSVRLDVALLPGETGDKLFSDKSFFDIVNFKINSTMYFKDLNCIP